MEMAIAPWSRASGELIAGTWRVNRSKARGAQQSGRFVGAMGVGLQRATLPIAAREAAVLNNSQGQLPEPLTPSHRLIVRLPSRYAHSMPRPPGFSGRGADELDA